MYLPLIVLVCLWLVLWQGLRIGRRGYRKQVLDQQERLAKIEGHLAAMSSQLERIVAALEKR
jgi:hypothetical protein